MSAPSAAPAASAAAAPAAAAVAASAAAVASPLKIYFCASIRGGTVDKPFLNQLITHLSSTHGPVLTEHIGFAVCEASSMTDQLIYDRDVAWLRESTLVVAECSSVSIGVGYELAYAEKLGKPILVLYQWPRPDGKHLSAMIAGNTVYARQEVQHYTDAKQAKDIMDQWIAKWRTILDKEAEDSAAAAAAAQNSK